MRWKYIRDVERHLEQDAEEKCWRAANECTRNVSHTLVLSRAISSAQQLTDTQGDTYRVRMANFSSVVKEE